MVLEDFFTLTEMKDGLSSLNRVEELVDVMQKQKDCVSSIMGDAARQWLTVASTLIATENKDCLNHFVHLNGLCFLNQLLQEAKNCSKDVSAHVEEFICTLLSTLERLPVDKDRLTAAAIGVTIEQLLSHESLLVKDRARILLSMWNNALTDDASHQDREKGEQCPSQNGQPKTSTDSKTIEKGAGSDTALGISPCDEGTGEGSLQVHSAGTECHQNVTRCTESSTAGPYDDEKASITSQMNSTTSSNSVGVVKEMQTLGSNFAPLSHPEKLAVTEEPSICPAAGLASAGTCSSLIGKEGDEELNDDIPGDVEEMEVDPKENSHSQKETCNASSTSFASIPVTATELVPCNIDSKVSESCISKTTEHENDTGVIDEVQAYLKEPKSQQSSGNILETCFQKNEARSDSNVNDFGSDANLDEVESVLPTNSSMAQTRTADEIAQRSTLELEYEDALEVARQVAVEVEREVVDYREPFCSSPEANSGETTAVDTPGLLHGKVGQRLLGDGYKSATGKDDSDSSSFPIDDVSPESIYTNPDKSEVVTEPAEGTSATEEEEDGQLDRNRCVIDLNEDISAEDLDCSASQVPYIPVSVLTPIAVIATPRESQGLPGTPLHFEGELGWKGSAATSAFQPASSRRTPDAEKISFPKQIPNFLGFDLNVAENEEGVALGRHPTKQIMLSSRLPSCDSSIEVGSKIAERLKLDLNRLSDEDPSICPSSNWRFPYQGGDQSLSSASSSCSKQPYARDFDLNDNPSFFDADKTKYLGKSSSNPSCVINPVITIMGSRMAVERKDYTEQSQQSSMGTGSNIEHTMPARTMYPYHQMIPLPYGHNGLPVAPPIPIPPPLYGHGDIPYHMIDPRGFAVTPQVMASSPAQSSFLMGLSGAPSGFSGVVGSSRTGLDLNSGTISLEVGSREEQMFMRGPGDLMEEQQRGSFASNSSLSLKRKELELGLESYPNGLKKVTSWH